MNAYAETSALVALFHLRDHFARRVNDHQAKVRADLYFPPLLRFELWHVLTSARTDAAGETAWRAMLAGESGRLRGISQDLLRVVQRAGELSQRHARACPEAGATDVLHVAAALELGAAEFWTCRRAGGVREGGGAGRGGVRAGHGLKHLPAQGSAAVAVDGEEGSQRKGGGCPPTARLLHCYR